MVERSAPYRIVLFNSKTDPRPILQTLALEEVYVLLEHVETDCRLEDGSSGCPGKKCPNKDGLAWSPGYISEPCTCSVQHKTDKTGRCLECGGKTRKNQNVESIDFAVFDVDHINEVQALSMCERLEQSGTEFYLHTTHTNDPPHDQNYRVIFPLTRSITREEWKQLWFAIVRKFDFPQEKIGKRKSGVDDGTRDSSRLSFLPRAMRGRPFVNLRSPGQLLDPDELLAANVRYSRGLRQQGVTPSTAPESGSISLDELRGFLRRYDPKDFDRTYEEDYQGKAIIRRVLDEEPLAQKGYRGMTAYRAGSIIGWLLPIGTPVEAALEIVRPAVSSMPVFEEDEPNEDGVEAWLSKVGRGFEGSQAEKLEATAEEKTARGRLVALAQRKAAPPLPTLPSRAPSTAPVPAPAVSTSTSLPVPRPSIHFPIPPPDVEDDDPDGVWRAKKMINVVDKQGLPNPKNTFANIVVVLENHRAWQKVLRYNDLTNEPEAHGGPIPIHKRNPDQLITAIRTWLAHKEQIEMPRSEVTDAVEHVSFDNRYDPIKDYLTGLKWDGVPRLREWLITYCGARLKDDNDLDVTEYVKMVGEKWLMAGAARTLYPGCKADNVLIFEGDQFKGKSKTLGILGGEWFVETKINIGDKDSKELTTKAWIIELAELASMKKSETEAQKAWFSISADDFRLSYAPRMRKFRRRCIFAGTTNDTQYLLDLTGNRRFWCVWCDQFDIPRLQRDRDQLWAEAVAVVQAGESCPRCNGVSDRCPEHRWWLDEQQTALTERVAITRLKAEFADSVRAWWLAKEPEKRPLHVRAATVLQEALGMTLDKLESQRQSIGRAMKVMGFQKTHVRTPAGGREWVYEATPPLLAAEQWILNPTAAQRTALLARKKISGPPQPTQPTPGVPQ